ncbi:Metallo-dependent phosphatase [Cucurbitaria berberidis CBS 394.84]|uniref:Metallo-dependent phosphatase n=1 Tax=Cucurbitaria berberidis CBS 394.84 TaxID=1168544 RepID=A0A9P4GJD8_9PLEO|nr:Metallo-dependent phosphatase [Cucurbitaria berberidis CBS 394.84]KAF1846294.1 Metallo-dependent phosphatase [Cucurbitaria berberidis CBS 394.84]
MSSAPHTTTIVARHVVTDITVCIIPPKTSTCELDPRTWHCIEKDLYQYTSQHSAWLYVALANEDELAAETLVVGDIRAGERPPSSSGHWNSRPGGIWVLRKKFAGDIDQAVTEVEVLFGTDAVDPRPQWTLMQSPLQINAQPEIPVARLSILHGRAKPRLTADVPLRVREDSKFKIVQISDTHMVTGVGVCNDAIDEQGNDLPESEADPLTVRFIGEILDAEKPDLVILTGDQLHHDITDSQTALFKVVAPIIERSIPFAAVFGNHDSEGSHALSRTAQMSILQNLPFSLSEPGPEQVDGVGNFYVQILAPAPSELPVSTLYFLDSHSKLPSTTLNNRYDHIKPSQIDWFKTTFQSLRNAGNLSFVIIHIPLPEFKDRHLCIRSGQRREPTEGPSFNSHFYDALVDYGISAVGCGHDHVNDFAALLPQQTQHDGKTPQSPWLCYGGASGFGGYGSYAGKRFYRRMRVWELNASAGSLKTWMRLEYAIGRTDELMLMENGVVADPPVRKNDRSCIVT